MKEGFVRNTFETKKQFDLFTPYSLTDNERKIALLVKKCIQDNFNFYNIPLGKGNIEDVLSDSLLNFRFLGDVQVANSIATLYDNISFSYGNTSDYYEFTTLSSVDSVKVCKKAECILLPKSFRSSSSIFLSHEYVHALKERNPVECKNIYTYEEMIPIFMEMFLAFNIGNDYVSRDVFKGRINLLLNSCDNIDFFNDMATSTDKEKIVRNYMIDKNMCYLLSYYYAVILFNYYLEFPDYIMRLVSDVLNCKMDTRELIRRLERQGLGFDKEIFMSELYKLKK